MERKIISALVVVGLAALAARSLADWRLIEEPVYIIIHNDRRGDHLCSIDTHLWVYGPEHEWCVRKLEQAAHTARFELWTISATRRRTTPQAK